MPLRILVVDDHAVVRRGGSPVKWKYDPAPVDAAKGVACCEPLSARAYSSASLYSPPRSNRSARDSDMGRDLMESGADTRPRPAVSR